MIKIKKCDFSDIKIIKEIADKTWRQTYASFIDPEQISYMYSQFYSLEGLQDQMDRGDTFLLAQANSEYLGFCSYMIFDECIKIPKLYVLPSDQSKGVGTALIDFIIGIAVETGKPSIELNVNRFNPAFHFYRKKGFSIKKMIDIPLDKFLLEDYIMQYNISR